MLNTLLFHEICFFIKAILKAHSLFCTDVVLNKANASNKRDMIEQMEFTRNVWNGSTEKKKTLAPLKNTLNILKDKTPNLDFSSNC